MPLVPTPNFRNKLENLAKNPVNGHKTEKGFEYINPEIRAKYGEEKVEKPYWYLKTKGLFLNSRKNKHNIRPSTKTRAHYLEIAKEYGYEAPSILEEAIGELTWYVRTGERLMSKDENEHGIFTFCRNEPVCELTKPAVGDFGKAGLSVCSAYDLDIGVAGVRRE